MSFSLIIYCFPHYGIIDNNIELIKWFIRSKSLKKVVIAFPSLSVLLPALKNLSLRSQLSDLDASIVVCIFDLFWINIPWLHFSISPNCLSLFVRVSEAERTFVSFLQKLKLSSSLNWLNQVTINFCFKCTYGNVYVADITQFSKKNVQRFFEYLDATSIISIPHGVSLPCSNTIQNSTYPARFPISWTVYLHTPLWSKDFQRRYSLSSSDIRVCGIPKHWRLRPFSPSGVAKRFSLTITLCSRPYSKNHYLLHDQKSAYLKELKKLVLQQGHSLIIKSHPGETNTDIYFESLGESSVINNWSFTDLSTSQVACLTDICILFYSGTCVDFIVRGIPCIERSNLEECPGSNSTDFSAGYNNRLISPYSEHGLVEHAYDTESLSKLLFACIENPQVIADSQYKAYKALFPPPDF